MATINTKNYSSPKNINLKEGILRFGGTFTSSPLDSTSNGLWINTSNQIVYSAQGADTILGSGGSLVNFSLNDAYDDGRSITVDAGAVTFNGVDMDTATFYLTADADSSGPVVLIANSGSGNDITGTSSTWAISAAGAITATALTMADDEAITLGDSSDATIQWVASGALDIAGATNFDGNMTIEAVHTLTIEGAGGSNLFTITAGDMVMSDGSVSITDADDAASLTVTNATATTGNIVVITGDSVTTGSILYIDNGDASLDGGYFINCNDDGSAKFSVGLNGATVIAGSATGTAALTLTAGDLTVTDGVTSLTNTADATTLTIVADAQTDTNVIDVNADAVTSGVLLHLDTTAASFTGKYIQCYDGAADDFAVAADGAVTITNSGAVTGLTITSASTTADIVSITASALTTGDALYITNTAETFAAGELLKIANTESGNLSATPKTGNLTSITSSVTATTADTSLDYDALLISRSNIANCEGFTLTAAGSALKILLTSTDTAGTCTDSTVALEIQTADGGTAAPTGDVVKITSVGVGAKAINLASASTTVSDVLLTGSGAKADNKAVLEVASIGATDAGGSLLRVAHSGTGTPAAATSYLVDFDYSGATMTNNPITMIVNSGSSTAAGIKITGSGAPATGNLQIASTATGALGAVINLDQTANSAANSDVIGRILFTAQDNANAAETYGRIDCVVRDVTAANPDASLAFYADRAGTNTLALEIGWDTTNGAAINGIMVGDTAGAAIVSSNGTQDLTLETNGGTNSGVITITDGANGDIAITPNGTGQTQLTAPTYGQITAGADGAATLTIAMVGLYTIGNTVARTLTLPAAATSAGAWFTIKKTSADAAAVTIDANGDELIDGAATFAEVDAQYDSATVVCDGTGWHVVSKIIAA